MTWTVTNFLIEIVAGIAGAHVATVMAGDYRFGRIAEFIVGAIGGGISGCFLQTMIAITITANGAFNEPRLFELLVAQGLAGATTGGILMMIVGFLKHGIDAHRASKL